MDSPSKTDEERNERIQTFLKIKSPEIGDKPYFTIENNNKVFVLHDPIIKVESDKSQKYEIDKIFEDNTSYKNIYNEITNNCINESLKGTYYTFITYGDSTSEKKDIIFGKNNCDVINENRGLFPRLIEDYLNIKQLENIILKINFIAVNGNKIIDLYKLNEINDKIHTKITQNELLDKYSIDIKMNNEILQKMKLVNINNLKDVFFMFRVYSLLERLDEGLFHLLSWSNFAFIIRSLLCKVLKDEHLVLFYTSKLHKYE